MIEKLLNSPKAFLLLVITTSIIFPIGGGILQFVSCPEPAGMAYFPFASANCVGEFIGHLGIFCFGLPGLVLSFAALSLLSSLFDSFNNISADIWLLTLAVLALILNFIVHFFYLRFALVTIHVKTSPGTQEQGQY